MTLNIELIIAHIEKEKREKAERERGEASRLPLYIDDIELWREK